MKTVTVNVYEIDELNQSAKERAYKKWYHEADYPYGDENRKTLDRFCEIFNIRVYNWEYDSCNYSFRLEVLNENIENLSHLRLLAHLNNYFDDIYKGKYYSKGKLVDGKYSYIHRHSKVMFESDCSLTGYCMDYDILEPIFKFMKEPRNITFKDLMNECLHSFFEACRNDVYENYTFENFEELAKENEWLYRENGSMHY